MSKPLINRLLLENSNKPDDTTPETLREVPVPKWNQDSLFGEWWTPQKSKDAREQAWQITGLRTTDFATARVLFRKVAKGLDKKDFVIA
jgi:hypothetical protein